ncbi:hypothetical protein LEN26_010557 [Aphanomyces euteiches]|nr:hypothetical protein AeMF1_011117 [Aphanomyces euteiches]KAH9121718.1 hypothetical protein LEN26_010557 [Aphanomyces euteiches]KAH9189872.1 hypothetical protein AeNC1_008144 [Aphanomyces euteiches]
MFSRAAPLVAARLRSPATLLRQPYAQQFLGLLRPTLPRNVIRPERALLFSSTTDGATTAAKTPRTNKFKELWNKYGWVGVGTYLSVYVTTLGSMFVAIETGLLSTGAPKEGESEDGNGSFNIVSATNALTEWTKSVGLGSHFNVPEVSPATGSFLIAWVATKFTEPIRLAVTLMITPRIARYLRARKP